MGSALQVDQDASCNLAAGPEVLVKGGELRYSTGSSISHCIALQSFLLGRSRLLAYLSTPTSFKHA